MVIRIAGGMPRNVWVLSLVAFLVMVGFGVLVPVLPVFARGFGVSQFAVGAVISAFALARLLTTPWCGRINQFIGERAALGSGIGIVALSTAAAGMAQSYWQLLVLRGIGGIGSAMFTVAAMTLLLASVPDSLRGRASAVFSGGFLLGGMAGPAVGGIFAAISLRAPFFFYAGTLLMAGLVGLGWLRRPDQAPADRGGEAGTSLRGALTQKRFRAACLANFASGWQAHGARSTLVPILVVEVLHRPATWTALSFALAAVVQGIALAPVGRAVDSWGRRPVLAGGLLICAAAGGAVPFAPDIGWLSLLLCVFGVGAAALATAPTAIVGDVTKGAGGSAVAVFQMHSDLGTIAGPLIAGMLADRFGLLIAFGVGAALMAIVGLWSSTATSTQPGPQATG